MQVFELMIPRGWLSPIDTRSAAGAIRLPYSHVFLLDNIARRPGPPWHLLASLTGVTFAYGVKDKPFAGRGKPGPRRNDVGEILVAAERHQAVRQAILSEARKCLSKLYFQSQVSRFDSPRSARNCLHAPRS